MPCIFQHQQVLLSYSFILTTIIILPYVYLHLLHEVRDHFLNCISDMCFVSIVVQGIINNNLFINER